MKQNQQVIWISLIALCCMAACNDDSGSGEEQKPVNQIPVCTCPADQTCDADGKCQPKAPCNNACTGEQVCKNNSCIPKECEHCGDNQTCVGKKCVDNSKICEPACVGEQTCIDNTCQLVCDKPCDVYCCKEDQLCDSVSHTCNFVCGDGRPTCNGICCELSQVCADGFGCSDVCTETQTACRTSQNIGICCDAGWLCDAEHDTCVLDCDADKICEDACCGEDQVCYKKACKAACTERQTRCGSDDNLCCNNDTEICIFNKCIQKGKSCTDFNECGLDEFCDSASGTCVKASESPNKCEYHPPVGDFHPVVKWSWRGSVPTPPVVINLTDDNHDGLINENDIPDVVFLNYGGDLIALHGNTGKEIAKSVYSTNFYDGWNDFGAADVDNDGKVEVLVSTYLVDGNADLMGLNVMSLNDKGDGTYEWVRKAFVKTGKKGPESATRTYGDLHPQIADLDEDGQPEIITSRGVINPKTWSFTCQYTLPCDNGTYTDCAYNSMQVVADLDQDNESEIIANHVYDKDCNIIISEAESGWYYHAVADMLEDENKPEFPGELTPELIRVKSGYVSVWKVYVTHDAAGKKTWSQRKIWESKVVDNKGNANRGGGNPIIADFDGDGKPDIGVATYDYYIVFNGQTGGVMWTSKTQDHTSDKTGSSVFDFEGDGTAEVIYRDETKLRIYAGPGGELEEGNVYKSAKVLFETSSTSGTGIEYPIVVDVDNDGKSEVVVVSSEGVTVYSDAHNNWVRTRRIWNQHNYHVTNINEDGTVPRHEEANWLVYNNYRQNVQPEGVFNAPNFVPGTLGSKLIECNSVEFTAHVKNEGSYGVKPGLKVQFYIVNPKGREGDYLIGEAETGHAMSPSAETTVSFVWDRKVSVGGDEIFIDTASKVYFYIDKPEAETPNGDYAECNETDNQSESFDVAGCADS